MGASTSTTQLASTTETQVQNPTSSLACELNTNITANKVKEVAQGGDEVDTVFDISLSPSSELILEEIIEYDDDDDTVCDQDMYVSGRATINLDPSDRRKKKKCRCFCCRKRAHPLRQGEESHHTMNCGDLDEVSLQSLEEIVVIPSEMLPLEMVASLTLTPSQIGIIPVKKRRVRVPDKPDKPLSLWGLIRSAIGKDLTRFPLPVNFAEPLSMLQRLAEEYEYSGILDKASQMTDSLEQLASIAAYTISAYSTCASRAAKPFNPMLGETYEFDRTDDMGWRCISEQVCHHPPVACLHCESAHGWVQWQQFTMTSKFRGTYLEINPIGVVHLRFKRSGNHYTWRKATTVVRNIIYGKLYIEQEGETDIFNHSTNERCILTYTSGSMFTRDRTVTGKVYNSANVPKLELRGAWDTELTATKLDASGKLTDQTQVIWKRIPLLSDAEKYYNFSVFASQLNEMEEGICPTDSRFRTDQRFMENGLWDEANVEKQRLEDKQREIRKQRLIEATTKLSTSSRLNTKVEQTGKLPPTPTNPPSLEEGIEPYYNPCWFNKQRDPITGQLIHMYNGEYWDCKEKKDWSRCPKLFD